YMHTRTRSYDIRLLRKARAVHRGTPNGSSRSRPEAVKRGPPPVTDQRQGLFTLHLSSVTSQPGLVIAMPDLVPLPDSDAASERPRSCFSSCSCCDSFNRTQFSVRTLDAVFRPVRHHRAAFVTRNCTRGHHRSGSTINPLLIAPAPEAWPDGAE